MTMLQDALATEHVILSSAGARAGQYWHQIITRKQEDIARANHSPWVVNSNATRPEIMQPFCFVRRPGAKTNSGPSTNERAQKY
jgi:hypothetical protein